MTHIAKLLLCAVALLFPVGIARAAGDGPPANPTHSIELYENGVLKDEKPATAYPEEIRFKKTGGQWVPVTRIEVGFVGKDGKTNSAAEAALIVISYYGADGRLIDHLTLRRNTPR